MMMRKLLAIPVAGALLGAALVSAQDQSTQTPGREQSDQTADRATRPMTDQTLAGCVAIDNQAEVAVATLALEKVQDKKVKEFVETLIDEHQAFLTKLEKYAPGAASMKLDEGGEASRSSGQADAKRPREEKVPGRTQNSASGIQQVSGTKTTENRQDDVADQIVQIQREIAQECLRAADMELQSKQGEEVDQCFLGHQIAMHGGMIAKLTVFQRHASDDLAQVFAEGVKTVEKHKEEAEQLMKKLDPSESTAAQRRSERRENRQERQEQSENN